MVPGRDGAAEPKYDPSLACVEETIHATLSMATTMMMMVLLRGAALAVVMAPMAVSDIRHRSVSTRMICAAHLMAAAFIIQGAVGGTVAFRADAATLAMILGVSLGGAMILAGRRPGPLLGEADGHAMVVLSAVAPWHDGIPVAIYGVAAGCAAAAIRLAATNIIYNLSDMLSGRAVIPFDADFFASHRKRRGERFTVRATARATAVRADDSGAILDDHGRPLFEPAGSSGQTIRNTIPMIPYMAGGACALLAYSILF